MFHKILLIICLSVLSACTLDDFNAAKNDILAGLKSSWQAPFDYKQKWEKDFDGDGETDYLYELQSAKVAYQLSSENFKSNFEQFNPDASLQTVEIKLRKNGFDASQYFCGSSGCDYRTHSFIYDAKSKKMRLSQYTAKILREWLASAMTNERVTKNYLCEINIISGKWKRKMGKTKRGRVKPLPPIYFGNSLENPLINKLNDKICGDEFLY